ncbi:glycosyltransferase [Thermanaerosceptrum fracticalcis]|nr:glycosyltransferase family 2 protein [Thermanaerosceptrum fracticalcis]
MALAVTVLKAYFVFIVILMLVYAVRHFIFSYNRIFGRQRMYYSDIYDSELPFVSVLIPMHNEENVLQYVLDALLECNYEKDRFEIIPINDNSSDATGKMLDEYHRRHPLIQPLHRYSEERGKPASLNDAMQLAKGEIIIVFDADYRPGKDLLRQLVLAFADPEVGAVMGRVIPYNTNKNLLTRLLNLERSGGYQADQQARYNLKTIPQYGGTVGGFRKSIIIETGGFDPRVLAEDTELTYRLYTKGWKVVYANAAECYEEVPETWKARAKQVRRWSRGHNAVMFRYFLPVIFSKHMTLREKIDGLLLLIVYAVPFLFALGLIDSIALFFLGEMNVFSGWWAIFFVGAYNSFGNFAPFYEIAIALMVDGVKRDILLLPLIAFNYYYYLWYISLGFLDAVIDLITKRDVKWVKTKRFENSVKAGVTQHWH